MEMGAGKYLVGWKCPGGCTAPCADPATRPVPCRWPRLPRSDSSRGGGAKSRPSMPGAPTRGGLGGTPTRLEGDAQRRAGPARRASCRAPRRGCRLILRSWHGERKERVRAQPGVGVRPSLHPRAPAPRHCAPRFPGAQPHFLCGSQGPAFPGTTGARPPLSAVPGARPPLFPVLPVHQPQFPQRTAPPPPCSRCSRSAAPPLSSAPGPQPRLPGARARFPVLRPFLAAARVPVSRPSVLLSLPVHRPYLPGARPRSLSASPLPVVSPVLGASLAAVPRFPSLPSHGSSVFPRLPSSPVPPAPLPRYHPLS